MAEAMPIFLHYIIWDTMYTFHNSSPNGRWNGYIFQVLLFVHYITITKKYGVTIMKCIVICIRSTLKEIGYKLCYDKKDQVSVIGKHIV